MPRPKRPRHIFSSPEFKSFRPEGMDTKGDIILSLEEFEAIRLIDYTGMDQSQAADVMNVSRQTVGRVLKAGRIKVSTALVEGHRLKVQGGCYRIQENGANRPGRGFGPKGRGAGRGKGRGAGPGSGPGRRNP
ncbi:MAG: DUF134 domain-containing protein [Desulfobacteraceae bacterium]|nr:MAG: DUF134 domain-containing protein [Desulfobacteraceae bacterium]